MPSSHRAPPISAWRRARWRSVAGGIGIAGLIAAGFGCSSGGGSDAERFCGEIGEDVDAVVAPRIGSEDELSATLDLYRTLAGLAPVAIEEEWNDLVVNLETASTVVPGDRDSEQRALAQAYATERSAVQVRDWLLANCSVDLGPVATLTPHDQVRPAADDADDAEDPDGTEAPRPDGTG